MKRCSNQNCESSFLFADDKSSCPFCRGSLVDNQAGPGLQAPEIMPPDRIVLRDDVAAAGDEEFLHEGLRKITCQGRILEIDHQALFNSKRHKLFNSLWRGEPYQFAHQTLEYTIRVENITEGFPTQITDFCLFGSYLGRLQVGDELVIQARRLNERRVVKSIYNRTTRSRVRPSMQLPAGIIRAAFLLVAASILLFIYQLGHLLKSGALAAALFGTARSLLPTIILCLLLWLLLRRVFPRRRR